MAGDTDPNSSPPADAPNPGGATQDKATGETAETAPAPKPKRGRPAAHTHDFWEQVYQAWKAGGGHDALLARFGISCDTLNRWKSKGVPTSGWPSFKQRRLAEDQTTIEAKQKAAERIADAMVTDYEKVRDENLKVLRAARAVIGAQVAKLIQGVSNVAFTRKVNVYNADGAKQTIDRPLDICEAANASRSLSNALVNVGKMEVMFTGKPSDDEEPKGPIVPEGVTLSKEELDYVNTHDGQLPPGMTIEEFVQKVHNVYGPEPARDGKRN